MVETSICFDSSNNTVGITKTNKRGSQNCDAFRAENLADDFLD